MDRKLATVRKIVSLEPIPNADRIELAKIDGWQSVVKKGEFNVGDMVVFAEIDSVLPFEPWSEFLRDKRAPDKAIRLKTCKLKGTLSQGVIFPLSILPPHDEAYLSLDGKYEEGQDVTAVLKIEKYNPQIPAHLAGKIKSNFPTHLFPKTDSERLQNLWSDDFKEEINNIIFAVRVKADGTSFSSYHHNGELGVCSRNFVIELSDEGNVYVEMFKKYDLAGLYTKLGKNLAIQAEVVGPGIQKNRLNLAEKEIRVFDVYDIDTQTYYGYDELVAFCVENNLPQVETVTDEFIFFKDSYDLNRLLEMTVRNYPNTNQQIEGLVFTPLTERFCNKLRGRLRFKVINPDYLLANE